MILRTFLKRYANNEFSNSELDTQVEAGWFDWFCDDSELVTRLHELTKILIPITSDFILDNFSVTFHNHCTFDFPLYDSIRFKYESDNQSLEYDFSVEVHSPRSRSHFSITTDRNLWEEERGYNNIKDVITWIDNWQTTSKYYSRQNFADDLDKMLNVLINMENI